MNRIVIIDDHALIRAGLRMLIENEGRYCVAGEADSRDKAMEVVARERPDVILLDVLLGEQNSLDFLPQLLEKSPEARVLVLTGVRDIEVHKQAVRKGAMGLVLKEKTADVLMRAIDKVCAGEAWMDPRLITRVLADMNQKRPHDDIISSLTEREKEVIALLGEGLQNKQIAQRLFISERTVRNHVTHILNKLDLADRLELVIFAFRHGLADLSR